MQVVNLIERKARDIVRRADAKGCMVWSDGKGLYVGFGPLESGDDAKELCDATRTRGPLRDAIIEIAKARRLG